jgi:hypothetical protein
MAAGADVIDRVRSRLAGPRTCYPDVDNDDDLRTGLALLERQAGAFTLASDGSWLNPPGGERVELAPRLRRLLAALIEHHRQHPGAALSLDELVARGWPGEKMDPESARNRVHVALTTLRGQGLRDLLVRDDSGYRLDTQRPIRIR